ncbi:LytTR family DNA-binding domain-containing protein [Nibrella saemangeumensis]|uniref:LytTR family DNA-binding domain-containing protein n=1 Tax=Nibrella saemangeumensis TaxID=1084526 RepID=A0ABP8N752_9BACT
MALSCIILDDELICITQLSKYIEKVPTLRLEAYFTDPNSALLYLENHKVDLIFLDMEMPNFSIDGLDFVRIMGSTQRYIFTTAYPKYALTGYEYDVIDFLHKPFSFERFSKAVQKARQVIGGWQEEESTEGPDTYIYVRSEGKLQRIYFEDIAWIESERNYISIYTEADRINVLLSISDIEDQLPKKLFARVHKSFIVAYSKIDQVDKEQISVKRQEKPKLIPLGELYKKTFLKAIEQKTLRRKIANQ